LTRIATAVRLTTKQIAINEDDEKTYASRDYGSGCQAHADYAAHYGCAYIYWRRRGLSVNKASALRSRRQKKDWQAVFFCVVECHSRDAEQRGMRA
jgi:hypothetical protein